MAGVVQVGVAHGRVLTQDVHAANLVRIGVGGEGAVHDLHHGVTGLIVQGHTPEVLEPAVRLGVVHPLVVGEHHGDQTRVAGALHIVLSTQGVQPGAQASDLAGDAGQRDQAAHVVGAVHMLAHTHAPQDHGGLGLGVGPCHFTKGGGGDAADLGHPFRRKVFDVVPQGVEILGPVVDEIRVVQLLFQDGVQQGVEQRHIGIRLELQGAPGVSREVGAAWVHQHDARTALGGVLHPGGRDRMVHRGVGADHQDEFGMLDIAHRVADRTRAHAFEQRRDAGRMAQARAVVHVVAAKAGTHQFLKQVGLFVAALGRAEAGQCLGAVNLFELHQTLRSQIQSLVPGGFTKHIGPLGGVLGQVQVFGNPRLANERAGQSVRMVSVIKPEAALHAQPRLVGRAGATVHLDNALVLDVVGDLTAHTAERANGIHLTVHHLRAHQTAWAQGPGGAGLHALAARDAGALAHGVVEVEYDARVSAAALRADDAIHLLFTTGAHTTVALDAGV